MRYAEKATSYKMGNSHRLLGCRYRGSRWVFLIEATRRRVKRMHGSDGVGETNTKTNICFSTRKCSSSHSRLFGFQWGLMVASRSQLGLPA